MAYELPNESGGYESGTPVNTTTVGNGQPATQMFVPQRTAEMGQETPLSFGLSPDQKRAFPTPPPAYQPGPTSVDQQEDKRSFGQKLADAFTSSHGDIPLSMKIKLAQNENNLKMSADKRAWDTFFQHGVNYTKDLEAHNAHMAVQGLQFKQMMQDEIWAAKPEDKQVVTNRWVRSLNGFAPGLGDMALRMYKSPGLAVGMDLLAAEPGPAGDARRELIKTQGMEKWVNTPEVLSLADTTMRDLLWMSATNMPRPLKEKLDKGQLTQEEFSHAMPEVAFNLSDKGWTQQHARAAQAYMTEPNGQATLAGLGIITNASAAAIQKKAKPNGAVDPIKAYEHEDFAAAKAKVDFAKANPGLVPEGEVRAAQEKIDIYTNQIAKPSNPSASPNVPFNIAMAAATKGKVKSIEDIDKLPAAEQPAMWALAHKVQTALPIPGAMAGNVAKNAMPHDFVKEPVYRFENGQVKRVYGPMTEEQYRGQQGVFTMSPAQKEHIGKLDVAEKGGFNLLKMGEKAYKGGTWLQRKAEVAAETILTSAPGFFNDQLREETAKRFPDLAKYVAARDAVLGTYAKGLGGETGVLTDQDIARVRKLFSGAYDTAETRKAKIQAFEALIKVNRDALANQLVGNQGTDNEGTVTPAQWMSLQEKHRDTVQGILGNIEDKVQRTEKNLSGGSAKSLAEPSAPSQSAAPKNGIHSLLENMRKGNP